MISILLHWFAFIESNLLLPSLSPLPRSLTGFFLMYALFPLVCGRIALNGFVLIVALGSAWAPLAAIVAVFVKLLTFSSRSARWALMSLLISSRVFELLSLNNRGSCPLTVKNSIKGFFAELYSWAKSSIFWKSKVPFYGNFVVGC